MTSPRSIGAFEAKSTLESLLDRVEMGEEIVITRHGRAVAKLVPNVRRLDENQTLAAFQRIRSRAQSVPPGEGSARRFDWADWKELRDEGRRDL